VVLRAGAAAARSRAFGRLVGHERDHLRAGLGGHRAADDMQPVGDQRAFGLEQRSARAVGIGFQVDRRA
jgi:hypothetical protein